MSLYWKILVRLRSTGGDDGGCGLDEDKREWWNEEGDSLRLEGQVEGFTS